MTDGPSPRGWSRISQSQRCEQLWAYNTMGIPELGIPVLEPPTRADYLTFGTAFHAAMRARYRGGTIVDMMAAGLEIIERDCSNFDNLAPERDRLMREMGEIVDAYASHYGESREMEPVILPDGRKGVELELERALPSGRIVTARVDLVARPPLANAPVCVIEHKTTASDLTEFFLDFQFDHKSTGYLWILEPIIKVENVWINAIGKPRKGTVKDRSYQFSGHLSPRSPEEIERWVYETEVLVKRMEDIELGTQPVRNTEACTDRYHNKCQFRGLCRYGEKAEVVAAGKFRTERTDFDGEAV